MTKVGEHVTLDIIGTEKEYEPKFFEKLVYKISKKAKVTVLEISKYKFEPQGSCSFISRKSYQLSYFP